MIKNDSNIQSQDTVLCPRPYLLSINCHNEFWSQCSNIIRIHPSLSLSILARERDTIKIHAMVLTTLYLERVSYCRRHENNNGSKFFGGHRSALGSVGCRMWFADIPLFTVQLWISLKVFSIICGIIPRYQSHITSDAPRKTWIHYSKYFD